MCTSQEGIVDHSHSFLSVSLHPFLNLSVCWFASLFVSFLYHYPLPFLALVRKPFHKKQTNVDYESFTKLISDKLVIFFLVIRCLLFSLHKLYFGSQQETAIVIWKKTNYATKISLHARS